MSEFHHVSVLLEECIQGLAIKPDGIYVDGTLGGAGHSSRIAAKLTTGRAIPAKNWRNMRFSGQKNAHLWKQSLFAVPVRFTVMQKNSGNRFVQSCVMQDRG